jgi:hypothetical protein
MSIDDLKSYARENLHYLFDGQNDFEFNETMLDEDFDPRTGETLEHEEIDLTQWEVELDVYNYSQRGQS